ncbi:Mannose-1-phosphate guanylyltransferase 1 [Pragia fontium]|nr:Mannose-1-phosphate guanylyltransferase 1 [Pragia fontium]
MNKIIPVIMAGGTGSRLWPLSRELHPKQFLKLSGEYTLLQSTLLRLQNISVVAPIVICNEEHRFLVAEQLRTIKKLSKNIILEPAGRNTAPAIAIGALIALQQIAQGEDPLLLVLAADHVISDEQAFLASVEQAENFAKQGKLVTFGIVPTHPETGYGYIRRGKSEGSEAYSVANFIEKPDYKTACDYMESNEYYWNSGMFLFRASRYLDELQKFRPDIYNACSNAVSNIKTDMDFIRLDEDAFLACSSESIDYAVMEHTQSAVVVPMSAGWSDVGSWSSVWDISPKDKCGNANYGDVLHLDSHNNYVFAETGIVATVGLEDTVVVQTKDAVLVASKKRAQDVKKIVEQLKKENRNEFKFHREVYRPWGMYDSIDSGSRYQVKRITVKPGEKLSIQKHHHRSEHWIVVSGTANVYLDNETHLLTENQSIYIPLGTVHALENPGKIPLELIEVQSGSYLGEDDIVRFEDRYGRL